MTGAEGRSPELVDSRRLTGPNPLTDGPAATIDVRLAGADPDAFVAGWREAVLQLTAALGWPDPSFHRQDLPDAVCLALTGIPEDQLYAATEVNDWAWSQITGEPAPESEHGLETLAQACARITTAAAEERNDPQRALMAAAAARGVTLLWDDDEVSLGLGASAQVWPARELPEPDELDWTRYADLPIGMITGTNGKSTTARYAAAIMAAAGRTVGLSSTDWIRAGGEILDRGDYSGPGGARAVLRHPSVDAVILETARGGLRRRGLGIDRADAAVITNVAEDHLGDFGIPDVPALLEIKWSLSKAVRDDGTLLLNADDPLLVRRAQGVRGRARVVQPGPWTCGRRDAGRDHRGRRAGDPRGRSATRAAARRGRRDDRGRARAPQPGQRPGCCPALRSPGLRSGRHRRRAACGTR